MAVHDGASEAQQEVAELEGRPQMVVLSSMSIGSCYTRQVCKEGFSWDGLRLACERYHSKGFEVVAVISDKMASRFDCIPDDLGKETCQPAPTEAPEGLSRRESS